jgi:hypothetical protein
MVVLFGGIVGIEGSVHKWAKYRAYIENYVKYIHIAPFCSKPSA